MGLDEEKDAFLEGFNMTQINSEYVFQQIGKGCNIFFDIFKSVLFNIGLLILLIILMLGLIFLLPFSLFIDFYRWLKNG